MKVATIAVLVLLGCVAVHCTNASGGAPSKPSTPSSDAVHMTFGDTEREECFCELTGKVDDCCCDVETVDALNNRKIFPLLAKVLDSTYFRFIRINLDRPCPFWPNDGMCASKDCAVSSCSDDEIPAGIREYELDQGRSTSCESIENAAQGLSDLDKSLSHSEARAFQKWNEFDDAADTFCELDDETSADMHFINLKLNPERYTGYMGPFATRIWKAIYEENCFAEPSSLAALESASAPDSASPLSPLVGANPYSMQQMLGNMCVEKRVFYRVISGLHASISVHLCYEYFDRASGQWVMNLNDFMRRFGPSHTGGEGPRRLKNIYFTYLILLRAVQKAARIWHEQPFYSGNASEDRELRALIDELVATSLSCPSTFDERIMFAGDPAIARQLKEEFRQHFRNVTRIMDCVGCDKCRLWGKIQTTGIATALKILFSSNLGEAAGSDSSDTSDSTADPLEAPAGAGAEKPALAKKGLNLRRSEIVALFNTLGRLSHSLKALEDFRSISPEAALLVQQAETAFKEPWFK